MKKLLYIFALVATIVACDKDGGLEMEEVTAIELEEAGIEVATSVNSDANEIIDKLIENLSSYGKSKKGNASSSNKGSDYIVAHLFISETVQYMILADESNDDFCLDNQDGLTEVVTVYLDNSSGDGSVLSIEGTDGVVSKSLTGNWVSTFSNGNNTILKLDSEFDVLSSAEFNGDNVATF